MAEAMYSKPRQKQFRGPTNSEDYNTQNEELYKDLTVLYNRSSFNKQLMNEGYRRYAKDQISLQRTLEDLEDRVGALEESANIISFHNNEQIDTGRFVGSPYEVAVVSQNTLDVNYGLLLLPRVDISSQSKLAFVDDSGNTIIPPTLEAFVVGVDLTADSGTAKIDTSRPEYAIKRTIGRIWERNVITTAPVIGGAECTLYIKAPTDLFTTDKANVIVLNPYPALGTDIIEVAYTTDVDFTNDGTAAYHFFPSIHVGDEAAIGHIPPGSWTEDQDLNAGARAYYFDPLPITGLRIRFRQRNYFHEGGNYIYTYGLSNLDLRYDKFLALGKTLIRFDAPTGNTISSVDSVTPYIWNVPEADLSDVFSWRVIWETAFNSGTYTDTPVPFSQRVWIEVTLNMTAGGGTPALSGLTLAYS